MRTILELLRIIIIFGLLSTVGSVIIGNIYKVNKTAESYAWLGALAILILLFVLYRNKLQFSGWYKGKGRKKLPKSVSITLISISGVFIISPFLLAAFF